MTSGGSDAILASVGTKEPRSPRVIRGKEGKLTKPVKIYIDPAVHRDLHVQARMRGVTGSALAEEILRNGLVREQEKEDRKARKVREAVA